MIVNAQISCFNMWLLDDSGEESPYAITFLARDREGWLDFPEVVIPDFSLAYALRLICTTFGVSDPYEIKQVPAQFKVDSDGVVIAMRDFLGEHKWIDLAQDLIYMDYVEEELGV